MDNQNREINADNKMTPNQLGARVYAARDDLNSSNNKMDTNESVEKDKSDKKGLASNSNLADAIKSPQNKWQIPKYDIQLSSDDDEEFAGFESFNGGIV